MVQAVVIVGAGQAGAQVAASLRDEGFTGRIELLGSDPYHPYQRPPLSKGLLLGKQTEDDIWLRPEVFYGRNGIDVQRARVAMSVGRERMVVVTDDGREHPYDILVLATGAAPRKLPVPGADLPGVLYLRDLNDTQKLKRWLDSGSQRIVVIGGGFIGLEAAATATSLGHRTTVLETAHSLMPRVASPVMAEFFARLHREQGTQLLLGTTAARIVGTDRVLGVVTDDGREVPADIVLVGIGVVPNVDLAASAGLPVADGVIVDETLRTADPVIFAIGDCTSFPCVHAGGAHTRLESVQNATDQARHVAGAVAGRGGAYSALPWFWSDQADAKYQIVGLPGPSEESVVLGSVADRRFSVLHFLHGRLSHVESVNAAADHMLARRLLATDHRLDAQRAAAEGFTLKAYLATTQRRPRADPPHTAKGN